MTKIAAYADPTRARKTMAIRATVASTCGSVVEWIDFTAYGAVSATVFPKIFLPR